MGSHLVPASDWLIEVPWTGFSLWLAGEGSDVDSCEVGSCKVFDTVEPVEETGAGSSPRSLSGTLLGI